MRLGLLLFELEYLAHIANNVKLAPRLCEIVLAQVHTLLCQYLCVHLAMLCNLAHTLPSSALVVALLTREQTPSHCSLLGANEHFFALVAVLLVYGTVRILVIAHTTFYHEHRVIYSCC